jgi:hypothetical protein
MNYLELILFNFGGRFYYSVGSIGFVSGKEHEIKREKLFHLQIYHCYRHSLDPLLFKTS